MTEAGATLQDDGPGGAGSMQAASRSMGHGRPVKMRVYLSPQLSYTALGRPASVKYVGEIVGETATAGRLAAVLIGLVAGDADTPGGLGQMQMSKNSCACINRINWIRSGRVVVNIEVKG